MRALRRHRERVAKARHINNIRCGSWSDWWRAKWWKDTSKVIMNEPGWYRREFMLRPARIRARRQLILIQKGHDPDRFQWPDGKKPHIYYW